MKVGDLVKILWTVGSKNPTLNGLIVERTRLRAMLLFIDHKGTRTQWFPSS